MTPWTADCVLQPRFSPLSTQDLEALITLLSDAKCAPDRPGNGKWVVFAVGGDDTQRRKAIEKLVGRDLPTGSLVRIRQQDWVSPRRDFQKLVEFLVWLTRVPDGLGETNLSEQEAGRIRALGFRAAAGPWRVPEVPHELVVGGLFESCSDLMAEAQRSRVPARERVRWFGQRAERNFRPLCHRDRAAGLPRPQGKSG